MKYIIVILFWTFFCIKSSGMGNEKNLINEDKVYSPIIKNGFLHFIDIYGNIRIATEIEPFTTRAEREGKYFGRVRDLLFNQRVNHSKNYYVIEEDDSFISFFIGRSFSCIDRNGNILFTKHCKSLSQFSEGLARKKEITSIFLFEASAKYGFVDSTGENVIGAKFDYAGLFSEGVANVLVDGKYGYINKNGTIHIEPEFELAKEFSEGLAAVMKNGKYGYINKKGHMVVTPKYENAWSFKNGIARVLVNKKYGYINNSGAMIIKPKYEIAYDYSEGFALVMQNEKAIVLNESGEVVLKSKYDDMSICSNGLISVSDNGKWGYINIKGEKVIECQYQFVSIFKNGFGIVWEDNYPYYINKKGKIISKVFDERDEIWLKTRTTLF